MKIAVLSTQTTHHAKYVADIVENYPDVLCMIETTGVTPPFDTRHDFEIRRDDYERDIFFGGRDMPIAKLCQTVSVENINDNAAIDALTTFKPDAIIDFGTRKVGAGIVGAFAGRIFNLHGGNPEEYRGLDSHLWAIYHGDFMNIVTCLHTMNETLDDGGIIDMRPVNLSGLSDIAQLRAANTGLCVDMSLALLRRIEKGQAITERPQGKTGRYYSFMPAALKDVCARKFAANMDK